MIRNFVPHVLSALLWGDRKQYGLVPNQQDNCWKTWRRIYSEVYEANQRNGIGVHVNDAGYRVMSGIHLTKKTVLEIGAGDIRHISCWNGFPDRYILAETSAVMMKKAEKRLQENSVSYRSLLLKPDEEWLVDSQSVDVIVSFYSLEHLYPLRLYLDEMKRILKPNGIVVGAIPAEGGLAWGLGRALTSRRWLKKNTNIDPNKMICWEHPNFADQIISEMDEIFMRKTIRYWPLPWLNFLDLNLVVKFIYEN